MNIIYIYTFIHIHDSPKQHRTLSKFLYFPKHQLIDHWRKTWHCWTWGNFTAQYSVSSMTTHNILALILDLRKGNAVLKSLKFLCGSFTGFAATRQSLRQNYWDSQEEAVFKAVTLWSSRLWCWRSLCADLQENSTKDWLHSSVWNNSFFVPS